MCSVKSSRNNEFEKWCQAIVFYYTVHVWKVFVYIYHCVVYNEISTTTGQRKIKDSHFTVKCAKKTHAVSLEHKNFALIVLSFSYSLRYLKQVRR